MQKNEQIRRLTSLAMFCALSYICVFVFRFHLSFLTFDIKDAVMTVGAMFFGPVSGIIMAAVVSVAEFFTVSDTGMYGLIMNFAASAVFTFTASMCYKYRRKLSGAVLGLAGSVVSMTVVMLILNLLITPLYTGMPREAVAAMIPTLLLPFNLVKAILNAAIVLLLYKPVTQAMRAVRLIPKSKEAFPAGKQKTVFVFVLAAAAAAAALIIFFCILGGTFA